MIFIKKIIFFLILFFFIIGCEIGPGGCRTDEECDAYCELPENEKECFEFEEDEREDEEIELEDCEIEKFPSLPTDLEKIEYILPMGGTHGDHIAPVDHVYFIHEHSMEQPEPTIEVYAPQDGVIFHIQHMGSFVGDHPIVFDDYRVEIRHDCNIYSTFIHLDKLTPEILKHAPEFGKSKDTKIKVKAGELIGYFGGSLDYAVTDPHKTNNLINPDSYKHGVDRIHIHDPFPYFVDEQLLIDKSIRTEEPIGGLIDYDVDGTLLGTWFKEGTNGWAGLREERYWADHLAIVYDELDPSFIVISIGTFKERGAQFGVEGNSPDPIDITKDSGIIKYELVDYTHFDGDEGWDYTYFAQNVRAKSHVQGVSGVALFQLLEDRKLKVEIIPDKTGKDISGFSDNAEIYLR